MDDMVEVQLVCTWKIPKDLVEPWLKHKNHQLDDPRMESLAASVINASLDVPRGFQPEIKLEAKQ